MQYTAENYQEKTYDEVALDRARNNMDDFYLRSFNAVFLEYPAAFQKFFRRIGQFQMILVKHILVDKQAVHHNFLRNRY